MINITLRGILGKKFGTEWNLQVQSLLEIFEAIEANYSRSVEYFRKVEKFFSHFLIFLNGKMVPPHLLKSKILKNNDKVEIVPVLQGGTTIGFIIVLIGVLLMVASIVLMLVLSPKAPKDVSTSSTVLGGIRNVLTRNIPVPVGYGRLRVGSAVISNSIISRPYKQKDPESNVIFSYPQYTRL
jgi:predicted phage tail protein